MDAVVCGWRLRLVSSHLFARRALDSYLESVADLEHVIASKPPGYFVMIGVDSQDCLGPWQLQDKHVVGEFVMGSRDDRGEAVVKLVHEFQLRAFSTFFAGRFGQYTCHHHGRAEPSMMDYMLSNVLFYSVGFCEAIETDATASDHRPIELQLPHRGSVRPFRSATRREPKPIGWKLVNDKFREQVRRDLGLQAAGEQDFVDASSYSIFLEGATRSARRGHQMASWAFALFPRLSKGDVDGVEPLTLACGPVILASGSQRLCGAQRASCNVGQLTAAIEALLFLLGQLGLPLPSVREGSHVILRSTSLYLLGLVAGRFSPTENLGISILFLHLWEHAGRFFKLKFRPEVNPRNISGFDWCRSWSYEALWKNNVSQFWKREYPSPDWNPAGYAVRCERFPDVRRCPGGAPVLLLEPADREEGAARIDLDEDERIGPDGSAVPSLRHITQSIAVAASKYGKTPSNHEPRIPPSDIMAQDLARLQRLRRLERDSVQRPALSYSIVKLRRQIRRREASLLCTAVAETRRLPQAFRRGGGFQKVPYLYGEGEEIVADVEGKGRVIFDFFKDLLRNPADYVEDDLDWINQTFSDNDLDGIPRLDGALVRQVVVAFPRGKTCAEGRVVSEMLVGLDEDCFESIALAFRFRFLNHSSGLWEDCCDKHIISLLQKHCQAAQACDFRPIAVLLVFKKLSSKVLSILSGIKDVPLVAPQFAFRVGLQAHEAIWIMRNQIEKALEWMIHIFVADGDIRKAYDFTRHGEVVTGMRAKDIRDIFTAAWLREIRRSEVAVRLDHETTSNFISRNRSLEQGDSAAPTVF